MPFARGITAASCVVVLPVVGYAASRWRRMTTWGATDGEAAADMPGDEIVGQARYRSTHAVTIDAPAAGVWPWLVQMGQGRGGLYSYDLLENLLGLDIHSAQEIRTDLQTLAVGDSVRLVPEGVDPPLRFNVVRLEAPTLLVLGPDGTRPEAFAKRLPFSCWTFQVTEVRAGCCRLVVRFQADFVPTLLGLLAYKHLLQPVHFVMERKMMLGIKERAERGSRPARQMPAMSA